MPKQSQKKSTEFKAGIFIIISLALLIFSILWLRYFSVRPEMTVIAKFINPGPLSRGLQVYYQGVSVGKVSKLEFSKDFKYTLVYLQIYTQNLKLPANVHAEVKTEGITGQKYIDIIYPETPISKLLADNSTIIGKSPFGINELQTFFENQVKSGRLDRMLSNLEQSLINANHTTKKLNVISSSVNNILQSNKDEINTFFKEGAQISTNLNRTVNNINNFLSDSEVKNGLKTTISSSASTTKALDTLVKDKNLQKNIKETSNNINDITKNISKFTGDKEVIQSLKSTLDQINQTFYKTDEILGQANQTIQPIGPLILQTLQNTNQAAKRVDCVGKGISEMFDKRFLLLKLLFGKPGTSLKDCEKEKLQNSQNKP